MSGKVVRGVVSALSAVVIVAGGAVVGAGTASAQSEEFVSSVEQRNLTAVLEWTPAQWVDLGVNLAALPLLVALDAGGSVDAVVVGGWCGDDNGPCPAPPTIVEQVLNWGEDAVGS